MRFAYRFFAILLLLSPVAAAAQVGPCNPGDTCPSGQSCIESSGTKSCFQHCTEGTAGDCTSPQTCTRPSGFPRAVCTSPDFAAPTDSSGSAAPSGGTGEVDIGPAFDPIEVELGVPIGGLSKLSPAQDQDGVIRIPFLGEYVNAVYRYMVGIVMVVAIVMVVYGGFRYLVGSTSGDIARGKQIIIDAIMGLVLVLAAYGILNTINPATTLVPGIELRLVEGAVTEHPPGVEYGEVGECSAERRPASDATYDGIFQQYAPCANLDWRVLKAVAYRESGFRECVENRYGFTGLFQVREDTCALRRFGRAADCNNLRNPEINTAAAAIGQLAEGARRINQKCPDLTDARRYVTLLYFGHNSGAGALNAVIRAVEGEDGGNCDGSDAAYDAAAAEFWTSYSESRGRKLPPNHDQRMPYARRVADLAISYGVTNPRNEGGECPVSRR